jgi:transposase
VEKTTLLNWVRKAEKDHIPRPSLSAADMTECQGPGLMEVLDSPKVDEDRWQYNVDIRKELRRRAVRLVLDAFDDAGGRRGLCTRVGQQFGVPPDTVRGWVHRAEINEGARPGTTTDEHARLVALEREVRELRRANAIVKAASAFCSSRSSTAH